jgi:uncharacterized repeat protein (TIGR03943 family)
VGGTTLLLVGAMLIRLDLSDAYQRYIRSGMGPWLLLAGILIAGLGAWSLFLAFRGAPAATTSMITGEGTAGGPGHEHEHDEHEHDEHEHDEHDHNDRVGWLLLLPVLALLLVVPPALGSFGVERSRVTAVPGTSAVFAALPAAAPPRPMTLLEFDQRAFDRAGHSMSGVQVQLTGFVARPADHGGFLLARYQIACCAADAVASVARISGASGAAPARDAWFTVTGTFHGLGSDGVPEFVASTLQQQLAPVDPYE